MKPTAETLETRLSQATVEQKILWVASVLQSEIGSSTDLAERVAEEIRASYPPRRSDCPLCEGKGKYKRLDYFDPCGSNVYSSHSCILCTDEPVNGIDSLDGCLNTICSMVTLYSGKSYKKPKPTPERMPNQPTEVATIDSIFKAIEELEGILGSLREHALREHLSYRCPECGKDSLLKDVTLYECTRWNSHQECTEVEQTWVLCPLCAGETIVAPYQKNDWLRGYKRYFKACKDVSRKLW